MVAALITTIALSAAGLVASLVLGHLATGTAEVLQHTTFALFVTLLVLLAHSMTMFYLIGKGRAIREAVAEGGLSADFVREIARVRRPVFSVGTLALALTMASAILGGGVDTRAVPPLVHAVLGYASLAANLAAFRVEVLALTSSSRIVGEINRLFESTD